MYSETVRGTYDWHTDTTSEIEGVSRSNGRGISVTVQLSEPSAYKGGELAVGNHNVTSSVGTVAIFPSFQVHKVYEVEAGIRHSVVAWFPIADESSSSSTAEYWSKAKKGIGQVLAENPAHPFASYALAKLQWGARQFKVWLDRFVASS
jgi:hypothetical protein